jgi:hypothetical protein
VALVVLTLSIPVVYAGVVLVLSIAGLAAAFGPTRRASSVDFLVALRME